MDQQDRGTVTLIVVVRNPPVDIDTVRDLAHPLTPVRSLR
jgi:hypothetical protein